MVRSRRRPVRIIFGAADPYLNQGVARTFHEFLPGSELFLQTEIEDMDLPNSVIRSHYGNGFIKQYVRDHLILRTEAACNNVLRNAAAPGRAV